MAALGIPTTRALAAVTTGEPVWRETPLPGAVLTRVASSHIRVGTFQFFATRGDLDAIRRLADHVIARHYPVLVTAHGKPFTPAGFGNWFRDRCNEANLRHCSAHGLRKARRRVSPNVARARIRLWRGRVARSPKPSDTLAPHVK
jgi:Protein adenylyltransferase SelO